jgi:hypothetical protein
MGAGKASSIKGEARMMGPRTGSCVQDGPDRILDMV